MNNNKSINYRIIFSILFIVVPTMYFGYVGKPTEMGIALLMGALVSSFINIDKFSSFKGAGFEAQLKDAKDTIHKAEVTMESFKKIIEYLLFNTMNTITHMGRISSGGKQKDKDNMKEQCLEIMNELNINSEKLNEVINTYEIYTLSDYYREVIRCIKNEFSEKIGEAINWHFINTENRTPSVGDILEELSKNEVDIKNLSKTLKEVIDRYKLRYKDTSL